MASEPGLDRHEWESEMAAIEADLADDPAGALALLDNLVERMLVERGYQLDEPVTAEGDEPEVLSDFRAAREVTRLVDQGTDCSPGDVATAVNAYRELYEHLLAERRAP